MGIGSQRKEIDEVLDLYRNRLDTIPDELFGVNPPDGGWSCAEVYSHILQATLGSTIALEKCTLKNCKPTSRGRTLLGWMVLATGSFPPFRLKTPESLNAKVAVKKITKEDARNLLVKCRKRVDDMAPLIHNTPKHNKYAHPRMGMLNARQWFSFILIHLKHHLKQLDRVEKKLQEA